MMGAQYYYAHNARIIHTSPEYVHTPYLRALTNALMSRTHTHRPYRGVGLPRPALGLG